MRVHPHFMKHLVLMLGIACCVALSWYSRLDQYSEQFTDDALVQAGASYAVARGINAIVSVLQTGTLDINIGVGGSIAVGQVLDPVNDLIERFSQVISIAIGSLVLQKILLAIFADDGFSLLLSVFGVLSIVIVFLHRRRAFGQLFKLFVLLLMLRFSLGVVLLLNAAVDHVFLSRQIEEKSARLVLFKDSMNDLQYQYALNDSDRAGIEAQVKAAQVTRKALAEQDIPALQQQLRVAEAALSASQQQRDALAEQNGFWVSHFNPPMAQVDIEQKIEQQTVDVEGKQEQLKQKQIDLTNLASNIADWQDKLAGKQDGLLDQLSAIKQNLTLSVIEAKLSLFVNDLFTLLVLFLLKTLLIPLAFFYALLSLSKALWQMKLD